MSDDYSEALRAATGAGDRLRITVTRGDQPPTQYEFDHPYAIVGRGDGCDVLLPNAKVSYRHAYLQVIEGRLFCVDLGSRNGIYWPDGPRKYGWVAPNEPIQIGPYTLRVAGDEAKDRALSEALADLNPLERYREQAGPMPRVSLEFRNEADPPNWTVNRLLTLIGRSPLCKLRFDNTDVSAVHCCLLLTGQGLWVIDLLGRGGTLVDGKKLSAVPLESGAEIAFAGFHIDVFYEEPAETVLTDRLTDNAAEAETSMDDGESIRFRDSSVSDTAQAIPVISQPRPKGIDWNGQVFQVDAEGDTLIVLPMVEGTGFRYQQLHVEANALQRKLEAREFVNLVIDLKNLNYFGSELIGVLIRLARIISDGSGRAAFCSPSDRMLEVLEGMRLAKLWPIFPSREEALRHVHS